MVKYTIMITCNAHVYKTKCMAVRRLALKFCQTVKLVTELCIPQNYKMNAIILLTYLRPILTVT